MVFYGLLAAAFFTFILGALWPSRDGAGLSESLLGLIGKSLWLSWIVVAVAYWLDLPNLFIPLFIVVAIGLVLQWWTGSRRIQMEGPALLILALVILACVHMFWGGFASDYRLIFMTNDAVVSWNRWATELTRNEYVPYTGAYPILFPGIWSLIYKAQGNSDVWIFAKLTLFIVPVILGLSVALLLGYRLYVSALLLCLFIVYFFFVSNGFWMLLGNMDIPISTMMLVSGVLLYVATERLSSNNSNEAFGLTLLAAIFVGLGSITKS